MQLSLESCLRQQAQPSKEEGPNLVREVFGIGKALRKTKILVNNSEGQRLSFSFRLSRGASNQDKIIWSYYQPYLAENHVFFYYYDGNQRGQVAENMHKYYLHQSPEEVRIRQACLQRFSDEEVKERCYFALVRPNLEYAAIAYGIRCRKTSSVN